MTASIFVVERKPLVRPGARRFSSPCQMAGKEPVHVVQDAALLKDWAPRTAFSAG